MALPSRQELVNACGDKRAFAELLRNNSGALGIVKWNTWQFFDIRGERRPSVQVNAGWCYDHGTAQRYELIDLIAAARGLTLSDLDQFKEAAREAELMITGKTSSDYSGKTNEAAYVEPEYLPAVTREEIAVWYQNKAKEKKLFDSLLDGFMRSSTPEEKTFAIKYCHFGLYSEEKETKTGDKYTDKRLMIPYINKDGEVFSWGAYRRESKLKILKRKEGKPSLAGEHLLKIFDKNVPVLWNEGDGDWATSIGLGIQAVTGGSASMRITPFLPVLAGFTVYFMPDNDEAGASALARWIVEIYQYNLGKPYEDQVHAKFLWWSKFTWNMAKKHAVERWRKELERTGMLAASLDESSIIKAVGVGFDDVIVIETTDILKKGYDFVDFASNRDELFNNFVEFFKTPL